MKKWSDDMTAQEDKVLTTELLANLELVKAAAISIGVKDELVWCAYEAIWQPSKKQVKVKWRAQMIVPKTPKYLYNGEGENIQTAITNCLAAIQADKRCPVCDGRMGQCGHPKIGDVVTGVATYVNPDPAEQAAREHDRAEIKALEEDAEDVNAMIDALSTPALKGVAS